MTPHNWYMEQEKLLIHKEPKLPLKAEKVAIFQLINIYELFLYQDLNSNI